MPENLLSLRHVTVTLHAAQEKTIIEDVAFDIPQGEVTAIVGGSGSGKTTVALSILQLLPPGLSLSHGRILWGEENLFKAPLARLQRLRGGQIGMVFQEPLTAFNPVFTIGSQIEEVLKIHTRLSAAQRKARVMELLSLAGFDEPRRAAGSCPHQLSGGMRQRAMIAQAIAGGPQLLIADEPTSNLDVTLQARIMELFLRLKKELKLSILLISHDLEMVRHMAGQVIVMTAGKVVEQGETGVIWQQPRHEYTRRLRMALEN